ncbi:MAG: helicase [Thaumarchaeota archaeon]|nr:helicase [Nitrososphaerota archaeon]
MSVRQRQYISLIKELLGPRGGSEEIMENGKDPRNEYVTGILEPKDYDRQLEDYGKADIGTFSEDEGIEDNIDRSNDFEINPAIFDPRALPKSLGLSFVIKSEGTPIIDFCATWARYVKEADKKWHRKPNRFVKKDFDALKEKEVWRPATGIRIVLRSVKLKDHVWHVSIYLVNEIKFDKFLGTDDLIFQPQIRVNFHENVVGLSVDQRKLAGQEESQLELLYSKLQGLARGHLCGATWKEIDSERPWNATESPLIPDDIKNLPAEDKEIFVNPNVRTEYLPAYSVNQSTVEVEDISTMTAEDTDAEILSEKCDYQKLSTSLEKIVRQYRVWIEEQSKKVNELHESQRPLAEDNLKKCLMSCDRIDEGMKLLKEPSVRLAFCFMNKVMSTQASWSRRKKLVWRPFQIAFILQCIPGIVNKQHPDRKICDLLWYPTGGGKTEAYLGLMAFTLALRRLRKDSESLSTAGTTVLSRYTLRLLTIQQFRRALSAITACELLRIENWMPSGSEEKWEKIWGTTRFSIGLWLGGDVTPNNIVDHTGFDVSKKVGKRYAGAISILKYSHQRTSRPGEIVSYSGEPAQVIKCPCCSSVLSVPAAGLSGREHEIFWIIKAEQKPKINITDLDYRDFKIREVKIHDLPNKGYYSVQIKFTINRDKLTDNLVWDWWKSQAEKILGGKLACAAPSRPGYFIVTAPDVYKHPVDFELHCPDPSCKLNSFTWSETVPSDDAAHGFFVPPEAFIIPSTNASFSIPIPAYTTDGQVYTRCPSVVIATVDKFARLPFEPKAAAIFGNVNSYDSIWGYHRDIAPPDTGDSKKRGKIIKVNGFLPPELIIQDELHLIEGPLGSMVGLYETAIDFLATIFRDSQTIIPKYIASTATTRQASTQIRALYNRDLRQFPQSGMTALDTFFSNAKEGHPLDDSGPGRLYVGVCGPGKGPQTPTIRIWSTILQEAERIRVQGTGRVEGELDYFWTVVGYFNAMRELAAARSLYRQDIPERMKQLDGPTNARSIEDYNLLELNSNTDSSRIPAIIEQLESSESGVDAVMATSMFGTGVDIDRLSLMIVHGQPKTTASYIQATGRVGRKKGALVVTFLRSTRPRDLDHYEFFTGYHRALHRYVEPVTVAPFSPRACDRALGPVAVAILRNGISVKGVRIHPDWAHESEYWKGAKGNSGSRRMNNNRGVPELDAIIDALEDRSQNQPKNRERPKGVIERNLDSDFDKWENIAKIENGLFYAEPAFNYQPNNAVVLGDEQHKQNKKRMVFENTPQSMRDVESTTRFSG